MGVNGFMGAGPNGTEGARWNRIRAFRNGVVLLHYSSDGVQRRHSA
jgi:hypothetical protein